MADALLMARLVEEAKKDGIQQLVVGAVLCHGDRVLLLQRSSNDFMGGIFELPSGKVEIDETLDKALIREVNEETNLQVIRIGKYLGSFDYSSNSGKKSRQFNFNVEVESFSPIVLAEHDAYVWIDLSENLPVTNQVKKILNEFGLGIIS